MLKASPHFEFTETLTCPGDRNDRQENQLHEHSCGILEKQKGLYFLFSWVMKLDSYISRLANCQKTAVQSSFGK